MRHRVDLAIVKHIMSYLILFVVSEIIYVQSNPVSSPPVVQNLRAVYDKVGDNKVS